MYQILIYAIVKKNSTELRIGTRVGNFSATGDVHKNNLWLESYTLLSGPSAAGVRGINAGILTTLTVRAVVPVVDSEVEFPWLSLVAAVK